MHKKNIKYTFLNSYHLVSLDFGEIFVSNQKELNKCYYYYYYKNNNNNEEEVVVILLSTESKKIFCN